MLADTPNTSAEQDYSPHIPDTSDTRAKATVSSRRQAQDAILRLWPLNVRFKDYIDEGLDQAVIQDLFRDLGLQVDSSMSITQSKATKTDKTTPSVTAEVVPARIEAAVAVDDSITATATKTQKDKAEERKDRIARLLAAKGSKQTAAPGEPATQSSSTSTSTPAAPSKPQTEKSKLLQQKMEALRQARAAQAQKITEDPLPRHDVKGDVTMESVQVTDTVEPNKHTSQTISAEVIEPPPPHPVSVTQHKRPSPAEPSDSLDKPSKRPFGQPRQAQPFLIDVSDDENDEAMDLDSPELRPASVNRPSSPFKITPFRDLHTAPNPMLNRQVSSPMTTPPISTSGKGNLEHMHKEIELMKKKIAEAEARKKFRPSAPGSPSVDMTASPGQAAEAVINGAPEGSSQSPQPSGVHQTMAASPAESSRAGRRNRSRSRSRAATDRLPIVEAHRKEKLLKLQALQSQVQMMEREIEESLREEERLRSEAIDQSSSEEDELNNPPVGLGKIYPEFGSPPDYT